MNTQKLIKQNEQEISKKLALVRNNIEALEDQINKADDYLRSAKKAGLNDVVGKIEEIIKTAKKKLDSSKSTEELLTALQNNDIDKVMSHPLAKSTFTQTFIACLGK